MTNNSDDKVKKPQNISLMHAMNKLCLRRIKYRISCVYVLQL